MRVGGSPVVVARSGPAHVTAPRSRRPRKWSVASVALAVLAGCPPKGPADAGQVSLAELGPWVAAAACACILEGDGGAPYCSVADCEAAFPQLGLATLAAEVDGGFLAYDPFATAVCFAESGAFCFESALGVPASVEWILYQNCSDALTPLRDAGQSCLTGFDCTAGICFPGTGSCGGTCTPLLETGAPCTPSGVPCDPNANLSCRAGACRAGLPVVGDPCLTLADCDGASLWCNPDAGLCQAAATLGESCQVQAGPLAPPCEAPDYWCDQWTGVGTCEALSDAGGPCVPLEDGYGCVGSLTCLPSDAGPAFGICEAPAGDGGSCVAFGCADGFTCNDGACTPIPGAGAPCAAFGALTGVTVDDQCAGLLACGVYADTAASSGLSNGFCGTAACLGQPCAVGQGACVDGVCANGVCRAPALGDPCVIALDCASGDCVDGGCADPYLCSP